MLRVGITGGMGSGKSTVCAILASLGVPVFDTDASAKRLTAGPLADRVRELLGNDAFRDGRPDNARIAAKVFGDNALLWQLNSIVHPAVALDFKHWCEQQGGTPYAVLESAILFESGFDALMDVCVTISAPEELRIRRCVERGGVTEEQVRARMANQMSDAAREAKADLAIANDEQHPLLEQVLALHEKFSKP